MHWIAAGMRFPDKDNGAAEHLRLLLRGVMIFNLTFLRRNFIYYIIQTYLPFLYFILMLFNIQT